MKTGAAPFSWASHARKVVQAFPLGPPKNFQVQRRSLVSNARAAACRLELSLLVKPRASNSWHNTNMKVYSIQMTMFFVPVRLQSLVRQSKSEEGYDVGRRFAPLWQILNGFRGQ